MLDDNKWRRRAPEVGRLIAGIPCLWEYCPVATTMHLLLLIRCTIVLHMVLLAICVMLIGGSLLLITYAGRVCALVFGGELDFRPTAVAYSGMLVGGLRNSGTLLRLLDAD
ncbi:hypothetical protein Nepgr_033650 [Nepenthes gracilis]|uniref:Uncharacterized protein n=1 Tax=Nepenthes gracilis TaxID=150966 RepID=A0AAD3TMC5_NEPGR|nr:hypothetical protein Nepgr_033650 [Nepenthes gracilis]